MLADTSGVADLALECTELSFELRPLSDAHGGLHGVDRGDDRSHSVLAGLSDSGKFYWFGKSGLVAELAALSPGPTQLCSPSGAGAAQGLPVPGDVTDPDEEGPAAARGRSRSPRQTEL